MAKKEICIVIGASHAGVNFAFSLRKKGWKGEITLYDSESLFPYQKPSLSKSYLINENLEQNFIKPLEAFIKENIFLELGKVVSSINKSERTIILENGTTRPYDKLVLATGARPLIPQKLRTDYSNNVFTLRTAEDVMNIKNAFHKSKEKRVLVIGGGYIGLEIAASLVKLDARITLLERENRVLSRVTVPEISEYFTKIHHQHGVKILTKKNVTYIKSRSEYNTILCDDGSSFDADIVILSLGILINKELAEQANLDVDNGIKVNSFAQTTNEDIYAIGDCTNHFNPHYQQNIRLESIQNAIDQGKVAAAHICGENIIYDTIPWFWSDQYDIKLQIVGLSYGFDEALVRNESKVQKSYSIWYFKGKELLAVDAINNPIAYVLGTKFIREKILIKKEILMDKSIPLKSLIIK